MVHGLHHQEHGYMSTGTGVCLYQSFCNPLLECKRTQPSPKTPTSQPGICAALLSHMRAAPRRARRRVAIMRSLVERRVTVRRGRPGALASLRYLPTHVLGDSLHDPRLRTSTGVGTGTGHHGTWEPARGHACMAILGHAHGHMRTGTSTGGRGHLLLAKWRATRPISSGVLLGLLLGTRLPGGMHLLSHTASRSWRSADQP